MKLGMQSERIGGEDFEGLTAVELFEGVERGRKMDQVLCGRVRDALTRLIGPRREDGCWLLKPEQISFSEDRTRVYVSGFSIYQYAPGQRDDLTGSCVQVLLERCPQIQIHTFDRQSGKGSFSFPVEVVDEVDVKEVTGMEPGQFDTQAVVSGVNEGANAVLGYPIRDRNALRGRMGAADSADIDRELREAVAAIE